MTKQRFFAKAGTTTGETPTPVAWAWETRLMPEELRNALPHLCAYPAGSRVARLCVRLIHTSIMQRRKTIFPRAFFYARRAASSQDPVRLRKGE